MDEVIWDEDLTRGDGCTWGFKDAYRAEEAMKGRER